MPPSTQGPRPVRIDFRPYLGYWREGNIHTPLHCVFFIGITSRSLPKLLLVSRALTRRIWIFIRLTSFFTPWDEYRQSRHRSALRRCGSSPKLHTEMSPLSTCGLILSSLATMAAAEAHGQSPAQLAAAAFDNALFAHFLLILLAGIVVTLGIYRVVIYSVQYIRTLTCLNNDTQRYFREPNHAYGKVKQHLIYAPLFRKRHNRELRISSLGFGVLPTRFQSLFLTGIVAMNVIFCVYNIEWHGNQSALLNHLRNRTGTLAVVNMIPLVIMAGRNNPLISLLNISYDTFNLIHRWFGRIVVGETIAHVLAFTIMMVNKCKLWVCQYIVSSDTRQLGGLDMVNLSPRARCSILVSL